jgi:hypothetical protein
MSLREIGFPYVAPEGALFAAALAAYQKACPDTHLIHTTQI